MLAITLCICVCMLESWSGRMCIVYMCPHQLFILMVSLSFCPLFHPSLPLPNPPHHPPGCTGLEELLGIEPAFSEFQDTLFSHASMTLERSVQAKEVNEKLDVGISLFLTRLSPYFLLKPAQKCIEWLIHRLVCSHLLSESVSCRVAVVLFTVLGCGNNQRTKPHIQVSPDFTLLSQITTQAFQQQQQNE